MWRSCPPLSGPVGRRPPGVCKLVTRSPCSLPPPSGAPWGAFVQALREKNHQIRQEQWRAIKAQAVKEHDGQFRRRKQSLASPPAPLAPVALVPAKAAQVQ